MISFEYPLILSLFLTLMVFFILIYKPQNKRKSSVIPTNWPLIGMTPALFANLHQLLDYSTQLLTHSNGTFMAKGPWFTNMDMLFTTHPLDIHHILTKNFNNYPKGDHFFKIFDTFGDGIFNADGHLWELNRKLAVSLFKHDGCLSLLEAITRNKIENVLLPILESCSTNGTEIDFQDTFQRFTFDTTCKLLFDKDPESLSREFTHFPCLKAFSKLEEAIFIRCVAVPCLWKLQQLLGVGKAKELSDSWRTIDEFIYKYLDESENEYESTKSDLQEGKFLFSKALMRELKLKDQIIPSLNSKKFHRDFLMNMMVAAKDTTSSALSWFFYNLGRNPVVEKKILQEIHTHLVCEKWSSKDMGKMVYLHGALCESLRLFPPVPVNHKAPLQPDVLPSGHHVDQNTKIVLFYYSMGRMRSIWGDDCMEFKPERWVSKRGGIQHEPSYKFVAFNGGPRTCVGKDLSLSLLKMVCASIIHNYIVEVVEGHYVVPMNSIVLQMKHGLKVRLSKRVK